MYHYSLYCCYIIVITHLRDVWMTHCLLVLLLARLLGQYCFACWRLLSVVIVCNAAGGRVGGRPAPGQACGLSGGRHCTAGQYGYVF